MADEFAKGLGIATMGGLAWMVLAGWYNTPSFESTSQMLDPTTPEALDVYGQLAVVLRDAFLVFAILGPVVFWFLVPAYREARAGRAE
jgi:hypothetical protein